jgi:hypothetical protein
MQAQAVECTKQPAHKLRRLTKSVRSACRRILALWTIDERMTRAGSWEEEDEKRPEDEDHHLVHLEIAHFSNIYRRDATAELVPLAGKALNVGLWLSGPGSSSSWVRQE